MSEKITLDVNVKYIDDELIVSDLGNEVVMMNIETGDYFGINEVGVSIWKLIKEPIQVKEICSQLLEEFEISKAVCEETTLAFLNHLHDENMIKVVD